MNFYEHLEHLLEIRIDYKKYMKTVHLFFTRCIKGDSDPIIKDLDKLIKCPLEKYGPLDWKLLNWVDKKVQGTW